MVSSVCFISVRYFYTIRLNAFGMHRRAFAQIERAALHRHAVGGSAHFAAERVDLKDEVPLSGTADRWIAGHISDGIEVDREQRRIEAETRTGKRRLDARVSRADDTDVGFVFHKSFTAFEKENGCRKRSARRRRFRITGSPAKSMPKRFQAARRLENWNFGRSFVIFSACRD